MPGPVDRARRWLARRTADAQLAHALACARAGRMGEALKVWRHLAALGVPRAMGNLGACYANGTGVPADPATAHQWMERAARAGDTPSQRNFATLLLRTGPAEAAAWYRRAAEAGDAQSQDQLSHMLAEGEGVPQDEAEARLWAEKAALQGIAAAATRLGTLLHEGAGGPRDPVGAARWWQQGAAGGSPGAAAMLGAYYHMGQGVPADQVRAMAWLIVGARRHSPLVRGFYDQVEALLSPEDLARAQALAAELDRTALKAPPSG